MNKSTAPLFQLNYLIILLMTLFSSNNYATDKDELTIGFGSCAYQNREQKIWNSIAKHKPDLFIMMGDNVYIDSADPDPHRLLIQWGLRDACENYSLIPIAEALAWEVAIKGIDLGQFLRIDLRPGDSR